MLHFKYSASLGAVGSSSSQYLQYLGTLLCFKWVFCILICGACIDIFGELDTGKNKDWLKLVAMKIYSIWWAKTSEDLHDVGWPVSLPPCWWMGVNAHWGCAHFCSIFFLVTCYVFLVVCRSSTSRLSHLSSKFHLDAIVIWWDIVSLLQNLGICWLFIFCITIDYGKWHNFYMLWHSVCCLEYVAVQYYK